MLGASADDVVTASRTARVVRAMLCVVVFGIPVFLLALAVRQQGGLVLRIDQAVIGWATTLTRTWDLAPLLIMLQAVGHPTVVYVASTLVALWVGVVKGMRARAIWAFATMMAAWIIGELLKLVVHRARPTLDDPFTFPPGYSFPSGHALNITVATSVVLILVWPLLPKLARGPAVAVGILVVAVVGLDRIFLGVHFPSDVVAGYVLGCCVTFSSWIGFVGPTGGTSSSASSPPA